MLSHLVTYEPDSSKPQVSYCLVNQRKFLKDLKVLLSEECIIQSKPLVCDFKIGKVKGTTVAESLYAEERYGIYINSVQRVISGHTSTITEQIFKKMFLLKVIGRF